MMMLSFSISSVFFVFVIIRERENSTFAVTTNNDPTLEYVEEGKKGYP